jgi:hypothetical protein
MIERMKVTGSSGAAHRRFFEAMVSAWTLKPCNNLRMSCENLRIL